MLDTSKVFEAIGISLHVSFVSTLFAFLLSIFFGYLIATKKFILKKYVVSVLGSLTSIPPVCAGLIVYLIISRSGPLGWMELLYTPSAMIIAQFIIIFPIMVTLIINYIEREYPQLRDELISYGASQKDILFLLITNQKGIYLTTLLIGFGRAVSEYGAAAIVGGSFRKIGGHNPIEISNYNCVLFFGPEMFNFKQIKEIILKKKAGFEVYNHEDLAKKIAIAFKNKKLKNQTIDNFKNLCKEEALKVKKVLKNFSI